jgi:hypothetical protein
MPDALDKRSQCCLWQKFLTDIHSVAKQLGKASAASWIDVRTHRQVTKRGCRKITRQGHLRILQSSKPVSVP